MVERSITTYLNKRLFSGKALIITGPRQVGKTTLLKQLLNEHSNLLWLNADDPDTRLVLENVTKSRLRTIIGNHRIIVIDEAQQIKNIGIKLKLLIDEFPEVQLIATGSSSFDLANEINEPLTGRKWELSLFPFSFGEMVNHHGLLEELKMINHRLVFGYYPDIVNNPGDETDILKQLSDSYLFKDILIWNKIRKSDKIVKLLQALAFQVGNMVSYNEIGQITGLNNETVESYIQLLEQAFVIFRLPSFSRNLRNELVKSRKVYFYDNGIRNTLISNFNPIELRNDIGALWENFLISERLKYLSYYRISANRYFWRTQSQQEVDYIEEREGKLFAYEFKWNRNKKVKFPNSFIEGYPNCETQLITPENFEVFLMNK